MEVWDFVTAVDPWVGGRLPLWRHCEELNWPSDFRGEPNDSEVGTRHGREAKEDTVAAGIIFDNLEA